MFHVELAPQGGIFGPLKSDLGVFWPFRATDFGCFFFNLGPLQDPCDPEKTTPKDRSLELS